MLGGGRPRALARAANRDGRRRAGRRHSSQTRSQRGHEGVVVKALDSLYEAGRRGTGWIKVKPVHSWIW